MCTSQFENHCVNILIHSLPHRLLMFYFHHLKISLLWATIPSANKTHGDQQKRRSDSLAFQIASFISRNKRIRGNMIPHAGGHITASRHNLPSCCFSLHFEKAS